MTFHNKICSMNVLTRTRQQQPPSEQSVPERPALHLEQVVYVCWEFVAVACAVPN